MGAGVWVLGVVSCGGVDHGVFVFCTILVTLVITSVISYRVGLLPLRNLLIGNSTAIVCILRITALFLINSNLLTTLGNFR